MSSGERVFVFARAADTSVLGSMEYLLASSTLAEATIDFYCAPFEHNSYTRREHKVCQARESSL